MTGAPVHEAARIVLEEPTLLFFLSLVPGLLVVRIARPHAGVMRRIAMLCGGLCALAFAALGVLNLGRPGFLWHDEASILSAAAAYCHGQPLYHARSAPALYALLYGPVTFLFYLPLLKLSVHPMQLVRWAGFAVYLADAALLYLILRSRVAVWTALALLAVPLAILLSSASPAFGTRGDLMLLLCLCVGVLALQLRAMVPAALLCGVMCGLALDFKLTVAPEVVLLLALLYRRHRLRALLWGILATLVAAALPFLLPRISAGNYWQWLVLSSHQGLMSKLLKENLLTAALLLTPGLVLHAFGRRRALTQQGTGWVTVLFVLAAAVCILTGSKDGAGTWHIWPLMPFALVWTAKEAASLDAKAFNKRLSPVIGAIAIASLLVVLRLGYRDFNIVHPANVSAQSTAFRGAEQELTAIVRRNPGRNVEMGYGTDPTDYRSSLRFELPLQGEDFFLDENGLVESIKAGAGPSRDLTARILSCDNLWLIPHGEAPFQTMRAGVLPETPTSYLFSDAVRLHFAETHRSIETGNYYDLWACPDYGPANSNGQRM